MIEYIYALLCDYIFLITVHCLLCNLPYFTELPVKLKLLLLFYFDFVFN